MIFSFNYFSPGVTWGSEPKGGLIEGPSGQLYGTTTQGGNTANYGGTVFQITKEGSITLLKSFAGPEGSYAGPGLLRSSDGTLFGVTRFGGPSRGGTVFKISPAGMHSILVAFSDTDANGRYPQGELIWGPSGALLGTTSNGGAYGYGTVFSVNPAGALTVLHSFRGSDGYYPYAGLVLASDGNYYGTTYSGGPGGWGAIFRLTPAGVVSTVASFSGPDGKYLYGGLVENTDGDLYGMTRTGGALDAGTVFRLTIQPPTIAPIEFSGGVVSTVLTVHGQHFSLASSVTLGDVAVPFTVLSPTEIAVTLPPNALSAILRIATPAGSAQTSRLVHVVNTLTGDDDNDGLPNSWEIRYGLNPHDDGSVNPDNGPSGDSDRDGIPHLIEWALEGLGLKPDISDAGLLSQPQLVQGQFIWDYLRDTSKSVTLVVEASSDLQNWFSAGSPGAPAGFTDGATPGGTPPWEGRRASLPISGSDRAFLRLKAAR